MGWIVGILSPSVVMVVMTGVMAVMTIAELRRPVSTNAVQLPELTFADRAIVVFSLSMFTLAIANGLILVAAKTLP
jgi:hypothetical protein